MERLTERDQHNKAFFVGIGRIDAAVSAERLAAYEDCGLMPEDVRKLQSAANLAFAKVEHYEGNGLTMQEIADLVQAKKEGRIVKQSVWTEENLPHGATWCVTEAATCPVCKQSYDAAKLTNIKYGDNDYKLPKHCPECGAKMTGGSQHG